MEKILTIAIPAYNMEKYLERCLNSLIVAESFFQQLDVIIINDGSNDKTFNIAKQYCSKYPILFRLIDKQNGNWGSCINCSTKVALGKYFLILDADDWLETKGLENFITALSLSEDVDICIYNCNIILGNKKTRMFSTTMVQNKIYKLDDFRINKIPLPFFVHCIALKTNLIKQISLLEGIPYCDVELNVFMFNYINSLQYFDIPLYNYVSGRPGQSVELNSYMKHIDAIIKIFYRYEERKSEDKKIQYWQRKAILPLLIIYYQINLLYKTSTEQYEQFKKINAHVITDKNLYELLSQTTCFKIKYIKIYEKYKCRFVFRLFPIMKKIFRQ